MNIPAILKKDLFVEGYDSPETTRRITTCALTQPHHVIRMPRASSSLVKFQDVEATTRFLITFNEKEDAKFKAAEKVGMGWHLIRKNARCWGCF